MERTTSRHALPAAIGAGLLWALADWAASGLLRTPLELILITLGAGLLAGAAAGALAAALGRPRLGPALVLAGGVGLEGLSIASKELAPPGAWVAAALVALAAFAGLGSWLRRPARPLVEAAVIVALPAGALLAGMASNPWVALAGPGLPVSLFWLAHLAGGRKVTLSLLWAAILAVLACAQCSGPQRATLAPLDVPPASGPSLVLLVVDTLRADALRPDGELARFAQEGVLFRQCVSAAPWTLPSVGSILTGLYLS